MPPDPRDAELIVAVTEAVCGLVRAVHGNDNPGVVGHLALLVTAVVEHRNALAERVSDGPLRAAVRRLYDDVGRA